MRGEALKINRRNCTLQRRPVKIYKYGHFGGGCGGGGGKSGNPFTELKI